MAIMYQMNARQNSGHSHRSVFINVDVSLGYDQFSSQVSVEVFFIHGH